jgi:outer membrane murein-binding lipoprotein Lpp
LVKLHFPPNPRGSNREKESWRGAVCTEVKLLLLIPKGIEMNKAIIVKFAAAAAVLALAGCQDLKPLQADVDTLKSQVAKLQTDTAAHASSDAQQFSKLSSDVAAANQTASSAQSAANQALSAAQAAQAGVDATNEKLDRMFKKSVSK